MLKLRCGTCSADAASPTPTPHFHPSIHPPIHPPIHPFACIAAHPPEISRYLPYGSACGPFRDDRQSRERFEHSGLSGLSALSAGAVESPVLSWPTQLLAARLRQPSVCTQRLRVLYRPPCPSILRTRALLPCGRWTRWWTQHSRTLGRPPSWATKCCPVSRPFPASLPPSSHPPLPPAPSISPLLPGQGVGFGKYLWRELGAVNRCFVARLDSWSVQLFDRVDAMSVRAHALVRGQFLPPSCRLLPLEEEGCWTEEALGVAVGRSGSESAALSLLLLLVLVLVLVLSLFSSCCCSCSCGHKIKRKKKKKKEEEKKKEKKAMAHLPARASRV